VVDVVIDPHFRLAGMRAVQATGVLNEGSSPRYRHREEQCIEPRVVEPLSDIPARREHEALLGHRNGREICEGLPALFGR
jgi:hypothetical protein